MVMATPHKTLLSLTRAIIPTKMMIVGVAL
jgi:hypothetical protein